MYCITTYAYCGMAVPHGETDTLADARSLASLIRRRRRATGHTVTPLVIGRKWEIEPPTDCCMVPDTAGILEIERRERTRDGI